MSEIHASKPVSGPFMEIGGGIAGMQTAFDLSDADYYFHLVETQPSADAVVVQLDKTFHTDECAM